LLSIGAGLAWRCCGDMLFKNRDEKKRGPAALFQISNDEKDPD
jgi:hypothetical protein